MPFVHLFSVPTWASFCRSISSCCSLLESILCKLCRCALLLSLPIRNLRINTLYSKMITRQVYMLQCTCTVNSVKIIWFLWAQVGWLKNRSTVSVLHTCWCMKRPVSLVYICTSIQGFWYLAEKKAKFRGIFRGKFVEKSADFAGFSREKRSKFAEKSADFAGEKSKFAEKSADCAAF